MLKITQYGEVTRFDSSRTLAGRGYYWSTAYLAGGMLVDTGCAHTALELVQALQNEKLSCIVNTHSHEDHIGGNGILQKQRGLLKIFAHPEALPVLQQPRENQPLQLYRRVFWGWPEPCVAQPAKDGEAIETRGFSFQVIYTPGHSPDHICLYEPNRGWLFTGDLFVGGKDRGSRLDNNIWQIIASLKRVASLPLTKMFPGCARVRDNPVEELSAKIAYLTETGEKIIALHQQGMSTKYIARAMFGNVMLIELLTTGHFTRRNLVQSYLRKAGH